MILWTIRKAFSTTETESAFSSSNKKVATHSDDSSDILTANLNQWDKSIRFFVFRLLRFVSIMFGNQEIRITRWKRAPKLSSVKLKTVFNSFFKAATRFFPSNAKLHPDGFIVANRFVWRFFEYCSSVNETNKLLCYSLIALSMLESVIELTSENMFKSILWRL